MLKFYDTMKILFLDIDGVMKPLKYKEEIGFDKDIKQFSPRCVKVLNEIIEATDCDIVISSDWRLHYSLEDLQHIFTREGIIKVPIATTELATCNECSLELEREQLITLYIKENLPTKVAIVDDMQLDFNKYFVRCSEPFYEGISQMGIKELLIDILNR